MRELGALAASDLLADYAAIARWRGPDVLEASVLRTRSVRGLDLLAFLATSGTCDSSKSLMHRLESGFSSRSDFDEHWLGAYARALAVLSPGSESAEVALRAYRCLVVLSSGPIGRHHSLQFLSLLIDRGRIEEAFNALPKLDLRNADKLAFHADLARSRFLETRTAGDGEAWQRAFFRVMGARHRPFMTLQPGSGSFDLLRSAIRREVIDGPLVSVMMPAYRPDRGLLTAVRSIVDQTWTRLEILIVDDASGPGYDELFQEAAALDSRIRLIRNPVNGGTYRARNTAMALARGKFITGQDADDWSHPERVERQIAPLLANPALVASLSRCARVLPDMSLAFTGYVPLRFNASSLMIKTHPVRTTVGYFDEARKGADTEFHKRIEAVFGRDAVVKMDDVLALVRLEQASLSRSDFKPGWHHERRVSYRTAYERWHRRVRSGGEDPFVRREPMTRPFVAPESMLSRGREVRKHDVVLVGDWRKYGGPQRSMIEEVHALLDAGYRVAVAHLEALRFMEPEQRPLCDPIFSLIESQKVDWVLWDDQVEAHLVILRYPPILQFANPFRSGWAIANVWIVANQAPSELDGSDLRYLPKDCHEIARAIFGMDADWVPQGPQVRSALQQVWPDAPVSNFDSPGIIDPDQWFGDRSQFSRNDGGVVGRYSRDDPMKFPDSVEAMLEVYGLPGTEVRMMGAVDTVPSLFGERRIPENWTLTPYGAVDVRSFLLSIDIFLYFPHPSSIEAFGRSILEAVAAGCIAVLPPQFRETFGDAATYAEPADVEEVVNRLLSDPKHAEGVRSRAEAVIARRFSHAAFVGLVEPLLSER